MGWISGLIVIAVLSVTTCAIGDPYLVLGVGRFAGSQEIRKAYKQLAKEWHPDKTDDPDAEAKFVEIKQAYEILSDPERKKLYDLHGITDEDSAKPKQQEQSFYSRFASDPLDELFRSHGGRFHFQFQDQDITTFHKMSVTARHFENSLRAKSFRSPQLVLFYTDWCFPCLQAAPFWRRVSDTFEPLGIGVATVHAGREPSVARKVGATTLPALVLLLDGITYLYATDKLSGGSVQKVGEFVRGKMPRRLVTALSDDEDELDAFLAGWEDNRVRGLLFERDREHERTAPRLRYLITAFHFRDRVAFGSVSGLGSTVRRRFRIAADMDTVLLFNENASRAMASVSMRDIPWQTLQHVVASNQFLQLPRLSSQPLLEQLCPAEWQRPRRRLCIVLVTGSGAEHEPARDSLRAFARDGSHNSERVRFAYIYGDKQAEFVRSLTPAAGTSEPPDTVILWRRDASRVSYEWLPERWATAPPNETRHSLGQAMARLLRSGESLTHEAVVKDLLDEHAQGLFSRLLSRLLMTADALCESVTREALLPALSVVATVLLIVAAGYFMSYLVRLEEESVQRRNNNDEKNERSERPQQRELCLHELRAEKYNGLVRLLKPGCRTVVLIVDARSRLQLIPAFHRAVWPYRKNKTLMFAHMSLERGLNWYRELLQLSLLEPSPRPLAINPRNCVGTVLSLNGHRKYFCMFHAKHDDGSAAKRKRRHCSQDRSGDENRDPELGAFVGFEDTSDEDDEDEEDSDGPQILLQSDLLEGLPNWLDRLFEGTTRRYYINYWPDFPTK